MTLVRRNPIWSPHFMMREMDNKRRRQMQQGFTAKTIERSFQPPVDIVEDKEHLFFNVELPGVAKEEVKISVNDENILRITGEKRFAGKEEIKTCCRNERVYGTFNRAFRLPDNVDSEKIEARHKNGILNISIPKIKPVEPEEHEVSID